MNPTNILKGCFYWIRVGWGIQKGDNSLTLTAPNGQVLACEEQERYLVCTIQKKDHPPNEWPETHLATTEESAIDWFRDKMDAINAE